jgi:hypothetical protein
MRRTTITTAASMCLSVLLLTVAFIGTTAASGATRLGSVLPTGFLAQSQTWVSPKLGWILGVAPCGQ